ncbi:phage tail protein [Pseudescherichia vulneris]
MSQAVITKAFSEWKAQQAIDNKPVTLDEFIFAYIPGLDVDLPISNTETIPAADKIVHRQAVSKSGVVNGNSVVYSVTMGADVGDFDFNWIGLVNKASSTLAMIIHAPTQSKIKNASGQQGNVLVRSMLMEYSGAQAATEITTPAETWQIDFTARLAAMDERQRLENVDIYGDAAFFDAGYMVAKNGSQYFVTKGAGYVAGLRSVLDADHNIAVPATAVKVWLDVSWTGTLTSEWVVNSKITVAVNQADYTENGIQHYVFALASIDASGNITDLRPKGDLGDRVLKEHEKSRNHPDGTTSAKGFVQLSNETKSTNESKAATPKAVSTAVKELKESLGSAAGKDVTASRYDVNAGNVLQVGDYGLGTSAGLSSLNSIYDIKCSALYSVMGAGTESPAQGMPANSGNTRFALQAYSIYAGQYWVFLTGRDQSYMGLVNVTDKTVSWIQFYTEANKPKASDVGALPLTGGTMSVNGAISGSMSGAGAYASQNDAENLAPFFQLINDASSSKYFPILKQRYTQGGGTWSMGTIISAGNFQLFYLSESDKSGKSFTFDKSGQFLPASYGNFDARYQAKGSYTPAGQAYTKAESDNRFQAKGSYTPAGQAYTKAESDSRYNLKNSASKAANGWWQCGTTGIIEQWCQGATMTSEATQSITFPKAFPNACLGISVSTLNVNNNKGTEGMFQLVSKTKTGCVVMANRAYGSIGQVAVLIRAVGY